jgi:sugar O-acyltransferase (sialic acid O-acetyltransferase NeuD family)
MPKGCLRIGAVSDLGRLRKTHPGAKIVIAVGDNSLREKLVLKLREAHPGTLFGTVIHPSATVSPAASVSEGAVICAGAVIGPGSWVGGHAIVNTHASLDHHGRLGNFASLAPAAATGGGVVIGERTHIGMGAMVHHGVTVGGDAVVGSLSLVDKDLPNCTVAMGVPARVVRDRTPGEKYL